MKTGTNAQSKPLFEGQIVKFKSPHANVMLYDICKRNAKYGNLEWYALNDATFEQKQSAFWITRVYPYCLGVSCP
jgi:hypothetical protein